MESSAYAESTIVLYERLRAVEPQTGICLQAYLRRSAADVQRLLPLDPAIRLVKGAYDEPEALAAPRLAAALRDPSTEVASRATDVLLERRARGEASAWAALADALALGS